VGALRPVRASSKADILTADTVNDELSLRFMRAKIAAKFDEEISAKSACD
jgi:hypothetical protein